MKQDDSLIHDWTTPPAPLDDAQVSALAEPLKVQDLALGAWLVGSVASARNGESTTRLAIALVLDDPRADRDRPEIAALVESMQAAASVVGVDVEAWAYVGPSLAARDIAPYGVRIE